jgi:hypothetical protein
MPLAHFLLGVVLLSSPYLIGAGIIACWSPAAGALIAVGAVVGIAWLLAMAKAGNGN